MTSDNGNGPVLFRVPLAKPLTKMELCVVALIAEGWTEREAARMLGASHAVTKFHLDNVRHKIPGDLPRRARAIAWYRGAPLSVLQPTRGGAFDEKDVPHTMTRQGALHRAQAISEGRGCPSCGYDGVVRIEEGRARFADGRFIPQNADGSYGNGRTAEPQRIPGRDP